MWFKVMLLHVPGSNAGLTNICPPLTSMPTSVLQPTPLPLVLLETSHGDTWFEQQKETQTFLGMLAHSQISILTCLAAVMQTPGRPAGPRGQSTEAPASSQGQQ